MMTSLFQKHEPLEGNHVSPRVAGWVAAAMGFCLSFGMGFISISNSISSTAAVGYIFLPFASGLVALASFPVGWCVGYFLTWRQSKVRRRQASAFAAALVPLTVVFWLAKVFWAGEDLSAQVHRIQKMTGPEMDLVLKDPKLARNKFILGTIAGSPKASQRALHQIATTELPELHKAMGSDFDVMGSNRHGLAVMRLVAMNANTAAEDLERLAKSEDEYVLGDVAANPKLSEATLRRLASHGGYLVEWGLARNRSVPQEILANLALSGDQYTRGGVAVNPNAAAEVLTGLSIDQESHVRGAVSRNPSTPRQVVERLLEDSNEQVRREAKASLSAAQEKNSKP